MAGAGDGLAGAEGRMAGPKGQMAKDQRAKAGAGRTSACTWRFGHSLFGDLPLRPWSEVTAATVAA